MSDTNKGVTDEDLKRMEETAKYFDIERELHWLVSEFLDLTTESLNTFQNENWHSDAEKLAFAKDCDRDADRATTFYKDLIGVGWERKKMSEDERKNIPNGYGVILPPWLHDCIAEALPDIDPDDFTGLRDLIRSSIKWDRINNKESQ